jgi:hypothetical protein
MATDQLLSAFFLVTRGGIPDGTDNKTITDVVLRELSRG